MLLELFQISGSLADEYEVVGARGEAPHTEWP